MSERRNHNKPISLDELWSNQLRTGSDAVEVIHPTKGQDEVLRLIVEVVSTPPLHELTYLNPRGLYINRNRGTFTIAFEEDKEAKYATFKTNLNYLSYGHVED